MVFNLSQIYPVHTSPSQHYKIHFNIIKNLRLGLPSDLAFPSISYMYSSSPPFVLHALPISSSLI
jgi:hypothetical protein